MATLQRLDVANRASHESTPRSPVAKPHHPSSPLARSPPAARSPRLARFVAPAAASKERKEDCAPTLPPRLQLAAISHLDMIIEDVDDGSTDA
jgi:hypothetical protein